MEFGSLLAYRKDKVLDWVEHRVPQQLRPYFVVLVYDITTTSSSEGVLHH